MDLDKVLEMTCFIRRLIKLTGSSQEVVWVRLWSEGNSSKEVYIAQYHRIKLKLIYQQTSDKRKIKFIIRNLCSGKKIIYFGKYEVDFGKPIFAKRDKLSRDLQSLYEEVFWDS